MRQTPLNSVLGGMGKKLSSDELKLYKRIDEILFYIWDPIGIGDTDWSRDGYHGYLPTVFKLAIENSSPIPLAEYLALIASDRMDLVLPDDHHKKASELILNVKDGIFPQ